MNDGFNYNIICCMELAYIMFTKDLPGRNLRHKMKMRAQLKIVVRQQQNVSKLPLNFICVFLSIPECNDITSPNFELGFHLHFTSNIYYVLTKCAMQNS